MSTTPSFVHPPGRRPIFEQRAWTKAKNAKGSQHVADQESDSVRLLWCGRTGDIEGECRRPHLLVGDKSCQRLISSVCCLLYVGALRRNPEGVETLLEKLASFGVPRKSFSCRTHPWSLQMLDCDESFPEGWRASATTSAGLPSFPTRSCPCVPGQRALRVARCPTSAPFACEHESAERLVAVSSERQKPEEPHVEGGMRGGRHPH